MFVESCFSLISNCAYLFAHGFLEQLTLYVDICVFINGALFRYIYVNRLKIEYTENENLRKTEMIYTKIE